jgi:hypothetical protein
MYTQPVNPSLTLEFLERNRRNTLINTRNKDKRTRDYTQLNNRGLDDFLKSTSSQKLG